MDISGGGKFSHTIMSDQLARGLRQSKRYPRNMGFLISCQGAVGRDKVLQVIDELTRLEAMVAEDFPYPQIFVFTNLIIICGQTKIYEWENAALVEKLTVSPGFMWKALDFFEYVYMSNGKVAVIRDSGSKTYSETTELPAAYAMCNFNGQVLVGSPDVVITSQGLTLTADPINIVVSQHGDWA